MIQALFFATANDRPIDATTKAGRLRTHLLDKTGSCVAIPGSNNGARG